jgi:hypothetical protein
MRKTSNPTKAPLNIVKGALVGFDLVNRVSVARTATLKADTLIH